MTAQRLFFALWPDEEACRAFAAIQSAYSGKGRAVKSANLHLTLLFLGPIDKQYFDDVITLGDRVFSPQFVLSFDHLGYWKKPQVIWSGVSQAPDSLSDLVLQLRQGWLALGFSAEQRAYVPHLTLFRKVTKRPQLMEIEAIPWYVNDFVLVKSVLSQAGAQYDVVRRWPLGGLKADKK